MTLFTFGYEGLSIRDFVARLQANRVREVFDVRELPLSRKPGFSKRAFAAVLEEAGIGYRHIAVFGCPRPIRNRFKSDGNWDVYVKAFEFYLAQQDEATKGLAKAAKGTTACLVCFEADFNRCHRSLVAQASRAMGGPPVVHITATGVVVGEVGRKAA